jgi:hypothetical protein
MSRALQRAIFGKHRLTDDSTDLIRDSSIRSRSGSLESGDSETLKREGNNAQEAVRAVYLTSASILLPSFSVFFKACSNSVT